MKNYVKKSLKVSNGITLIALVITIVVLLILAAISISMLAGDNGILQKATDAKQTTERMEAKEQAQIDIMAWVADRIDSNEDYYLNDEKVQEILSDNKSYVKEAKDTSFITSKGDHEIPYSELYISNQTTSLDPIDSSDKLELLKTMIEEESEDCMIDEDGNIMPINWTWRIASLNDETRTAMIGGDYDGDTDDVYSGYLGRILENGELEYKIPVFIRTSGKVYQVTGLGDYLLHRYNTLKKLYVPEGIEYIGNTGLGDWEESNLEILRYPSTLNSCNPYHGALRVGRMTHLREIIIDSETVAKAITSEFVAFTGIDDSIDNKPDLYVKSTITTVGDFINQYYSQTTSDKAGYIKYIAN